MTTGSHGRRRRRLYGGYCRLPRRPRLTGQFARHPARPRTAPTRYTPRRDPHSTPRHTPRAHHSRAACRCLGAGLGSYRRCYRVRALPFLVDLSVPAQPRRSIVLFCAGTYPLSVSTRLGGAPRQRPGAVTYLLLSGSQQVMSYAPDDSTVTLTSPSQT